MLETGKIVCDRYEVVRAIGHGGMSTVYLARDNTTGRQVAIKDVDRNGQDSANHLIVQSLAAEGNLLKRLSNPHLPRIYDIIEEAESFMLIMDYVEGDSLDKVLEESGAQRVEDIYRWSIQICDVLDYLHRQNPPVVYRDMKPANVILKPDGNIMLIDFGTARTQKIGKMLSSDTICIGTEGFAAPEQFGGISQSDARTDVFCLGTTMYNLITGHSPSEPPKGIQPLSLFDAALEDTPLDLIIRKCTRNDPDERYQTALELRKDLEDAQAGAFQPSRRRGMSGILRSSAWQVQKLKSSSGSTGELSGLLGRGNAAPQNEVAAEEIAYADQAYSETAPKVELLAPTLWRNGMMIALVASVVFLLVSVLFAVLGGTGAAAVALGVTTLALMTSGLCAAMDRRSGRNYRDTEDDANAPNRVSR